MAEKPEAPAGVLEGDGERSPSPSKKRGRPAMPEVEIRGATVKTSKGVLIYGAKVKLPKEESEALIAAKMAVWRPKR